VAFLSSNNNDIIFTADYKLKSQYNKMTKFIKSLLLSTLLFTSGVLAQDWTYVNTTGTTFILYGMSFPPGQSQVGYACGMQYTYDADGVIVKTTDGGNNWTQIWPVTGTIDGLQGIWFTSDLVGFACGWNNYFIKTVDGGVTWTPITVGSDVWYYVDVEFWDANNGIALAKMDDPGDQAAFITSNGGTTWVPATSGLATAEVMGLSYATQSIVFCVGTGANVFKSTDGGHNWTTIATLSAMLLGVDFADANFGIAGGEEKIFATNNGGNSWSTYTTGYENFYATKAYPDGTGYCGGTDQNIYKTTNFGATWTAENTVGGSSSLYRIRDVAGGDLFACGSQGKILHYQAPLFADFTADQTTVCTGSVVNFTDLSSGSIDTWAWTFEGGTPATSSAPNPTVTYTTAGTFNVQLTVTSGTNSNTELKTDYITVYNGVAQPNTPTGPTEVCGAYSYAYSTNPVQYASSYSWEVNPASAGTITGNDVVATFNAANNWEGGYTIRVRAESDCGPGPWSAAFNGTLHHNPVQFFLIGAGGYCEGDPGAEITLDGSESGVSYELFKDNATTGIIVPGTGFPISFGYLTQTGLYTAMGFTAYCDEAMVGQVYVHMIQAPGQAGTPEGPEAVCNNETSEYSTPGASNADDYSWNLSPADAGILVPDEDACTITWNASYSGKAYLSVTGSNACGEGTPSAELEIAVNPVPAPVVSGLSLVCNDDESEYSTPFTSGSTYEWTVTGGSITTGAGTSQVTVLWGDPGYGAISVTETSSDNCQATSDELQVTIDDCTGLDEGSENQVRIFPNPARDHVQVSNLQNSTIRIYNQIGMEVLNFSDLSGTQSLDISGLTKGIYLLKVENSRGLFVFQLIKR
jgi:PKD repeat protein